MKDGLTFFKYLIEVGTISKENVGKLRELMQKMRPIRRDLVHLVDEYIKKEFNTDDVSLVVGELGNSWEQISPFNFVESETGTPRRALVNLDCNYMYCGCRGFPSCYAPLIILLILAIIFTAVFWYANVPRVTEHINANKDLKEAGVYIVSLECLILVVLVARYFWLKFHHRDYAHPAGNTSLGGGPLPDNIDSCSATRRCNSESAMSNDSRPHSTTFTDTEAVDSQILTTHIEQM